MERIEKFKGSYVAYAGQLGHSLGHFKTKKAAREALEDWHYFHPEERRDQVRAHVRSIVAYLQEAHENGMIEQGFDDVIRRHC